MKLASLLALIFGFTSPSQQACSVSFTESFLERLNTLRDRHGVPELVLDDNLNHAAQEWAGSHTGHLRSKPNNRYGENLYSTWFSPKDINGYMPVQFWYNQINNYDYFGDEPDMDSEDSWGQFTQLVWKGSERVGIGCAAAGNTFYVVSYFDPIGNVYGQFSENVPALVSDDMSDDD